MLQLHFIQVAGESEKEPQSEYDQNRSVANIHSNIDNSNNTFLFFRQLVHICTYNTSKTINKKYAHVVH